MWDLRSQSIPQFKFWTTVMNLELLICAISARGWLHTLCTIVWWTLRLVPRPWLHKLCSLASNTCTWHGYTIKESSRSACWIHEREFCCPEIYKKMQSDFHRSSTRTKQQNSSSTRRSYCSKRLLPHFVKYAESHFVKYAQPQSRSDWYTPFDKYAESQSRSDCCAFC